MKFEAFIQRKDVRAESNNKLASQLVKKKTKYRSKSRSKSKKRAPKERNDERYLLRKSLIEAERSDPNGYERVIGESNLLSVNFLTRGLEASKAVCRIRIPVKGGGEWYGTGFLVGPRLLLTNCHVIGSPDEADQAEIEFDYEHDVEGVLKNPIQFNLAPSDIFFTDKDLDVTLVAVAPLSDGGVRLERFGYLSLLPKSGKGLEKEWVTIIQHPGGAPKQMTIRKSQIIALEGEEYEKPSYPFIHYTTDTEPGSSGAPVLNDQWQVVAVHHKAIPDSNSNLVKDEGDIVWIANEGVRISAIFKELESQRFSDINASKSLERLSRGFGIIPQQVWRPLEFQPVVFEEQRKPLKSEEWTAANLGYDASFLSEDFPLEDFLGCKKGEVAPLKDDPSKFILDYLHFSVILHKDRKFPIMTAVNIFGEQLKHPGSRSDSWRWDIRVDEEYQPGDDFYVKKRGNDPVAFSRGHLVRRFDPCWGTKEQAKIAEMHTFHFTNAAPQVQGYNNVEWGDLEDYILNQTQTKEQKVTVLTGPVFKDDDPIYGRERVGGAWKIPLSYWKIAIVQKPDDVIAVAAFLVGQIEYVRSLYEAKVFSGLNPYTFDELQSRRIQTTIRTIEQETKLDFSMLRQYDVHDALESTRSTRLLNHNSDIMI